MSSKQKLWLVVASSIVTAVYFIQALSPLRLNNDNSRLLSMADHFFKHGQFADGLLPVGYPVFVVALKWVEMASPFWLVLSNLLFLIVATFIFTKLVRDELELDSEMALVVAMATLLNFLFVKYTVLPQSELLYFVLAAIGLYIAHTNPVGLVERLVHAFFLVAVCLVAYKVRSIGIALIPVAIFGLLRFLAVPSLTSINISHLKIQNYVILIVITCALIFSATTSKYWGQFNIEYLKSLSAFWTHLVHKLSSISQILLNIPDRIGNALVLPLAFTGVILVVIITIGVYSRLNKLNAIDLYAICYTGIVLSWPYFQPRFWISIVPILIAYLFLGLAVIWRWPLVRPLTYLSVIGYAGLGLLALGYSTWLTLSEEKFADRYGEPSTKRVYNYSFHGIGSNNFDDAEKLMLNILRFYEPRAKHDHNG